MTKVVFFKSGDNYWGFEEQGHSGFASSGEDILYGDDESDFIYGEEGIDYIFGGTGNDRIEGDAGDDHLYGEDGADDISGGTGNDLIHGEDNNDNLYGNAGNDTINAGNGDDYLDGGIGNDTLRGDSGNDTYVYGVGYGNDIIYDGSGVNKIKFVGLNPEDMSVYYPASGNDAILTVTETGETLTIQEFRKHLQYRNFTLEFDDSVEMTLDEIGSPFLNVIATDETETVISYYGNSKVQALGGDDTITGSTGVDEIYGGDGNDNINSGGGNDLINGGAGNDTLYGDTGNDTYVYGIGYGNDVISGDGYGANIIKLVGLNPEDISVSYSDDNNDMIFTLIDTGETLTIQSISFRYQYRSYTFEFDDGTIATIGYRSTNIVYDYSNRIEQTNAELLSDLYSDDGIISNCSSDINNEETFNIHESVSSDSENVYNQTDVQVMLIAENMSLFGAESKISEGVSLSSFGDNSLVTTQMFAGSKA